MNSKMRVYYYLILVIADNSFISKKDTFRILVNAGISGSEKKQISPTNKV
jgi:hypothetical protein